MTREFRGRASRGGDLAYQVAVGLYLLGLLLWLVIGLLPPLAAWFPDLHAALARAAAEGGPLSAYASRIIAHGMETVPLGWLCAQYLFSAVNLAFGLLLIVKRPDSLVPRLLAVGCLGTAATFNEPSHAAFHVLGNPPLVAAIHYAFHLCSGTAYVWAVLLFPDGSWPLPGTWRRPQRLLLAGAVTAAVVLVSWRGSFVAHPPFFVAFFGILIPVLGIAAQTWKVRQARDALRDVQSRLLRTALLPALAVALAWLAGHAVAAVPGLPAAWADRAAEVAAAAQHVFPAVLAVVPAMMVVAMVRHQLWDVDLVVSRALVVGVLVGTVSIVYVAVVAVAGTVLGGSGWAMLAPLVVVACVAEPLRARCQALCNRVVFGQRLSPRQAVAALVDRFSGVGESDELTELARVVVDGTRARAASVWLVEGDTLLRLTRYPADLSAPARLPVERPDVAGVRAALAGASVSVWPVSHEGRLLGALAVSLPRGTSLSSRGRRLVGDLARHAGLLVANAKLTVDLEQELAVVRSRAAELRRSRQEVVTAQDLRRRRLERDIHDGAQQQLVAAALLLGQLQRRTAGRQLATEDLRDVRAVLAAARETLAGLANGGAPALLAGQGPGKGLRAALDDVAAQLRRTGPRVTVSGPAASAGSLDLDTAVYFCCLEAVQNAVKHAAASTIDLSLRQEDDRVGFAVSDDGVGFHPQARGRGSGLESLRARAVAVGGSLEVESRPGAGTTVRGWVPLARTVVAPAASAGSGAPVALVPS